jgi:hypothetical protein
MPLEKPETELKNESWMLLFSMVYPHSVVPTDRLDAVGGT